MRRRQEADLKGQAERDKILFDMGFVPSQQYVQDTYGDGFAPPSADQPTPLNGAQLKSIIDLVSQVQQGALASEVGAELLKLAVPTLTDDLAARIAQPPQDTAQDAGQGATQGQDAAVDLDQVSALFAAAKACAKGLSCGNSCISKKKTCRKDLTPEQLAKHKATVKATKAGSGGGSAGAAQLKEPNPEITVANDLKGLIDAEVQASDLKNTALQSEIEQLRQSREGLKGAKYSRATKVILGKEEEARAINFALKLRVRRIIAEYAIKNGRPTRDMAHGMSTLESFLELDIGGMVLYDPNGFDVSSAATRFAADLLMRRPPYPDALLQHTREVYFTSQPNRHDAFWKVKYNNPDHVSAATGGNGQIVVYNDRWMSLNTFSHEAGHNLATGIYGTTSPPRSSKYYKRTANVREVSDYAKNSLAESFAEDVSKYFEVPAMKDKHPERYKVMDEIINGRTK
jgi:hypothetical protein